MSEPAATAEEWSRIIPFIRDAAHFREMVEDINRTGREVAPDAPPVMIVIGEGDDALYTMNPTVADFVRRNTAWSRAQSDED